MKDKIMDEPQDKNFDELPECRTARWAHHLALIPLLGFFLYIILSFVALYKIGNVGMTGFHWLRRGFWRMCLGTVLALLIFGIFFELYSNQKRALSTRYNRMRIDLAIVTYKIKTGVYPNDDLQKLFWHQDKGTIEIPLPPELISSQETNPSSPNRRVYNKLGTEGGWFYDRTTGKVTVNYNKKLSGWWGKYAGQNPSEW